MAARKKASVRGAGHWRLRELDSNQRPSGYEPDELPLLHPASYATPCGAAKQPVQVHRMSLEWPGHRPIFPWSCPHSIVGAEAFHFRVRDGNGWVHLAHDTQAAC